VTAPRHWLNSCPPREPYLLETEDIRLLTQVGFIASARADVQRAERIFGALLCVRPDRAFAPVGIATALLNAGRAGDAAQRLANAQPAAGEEADMVQAFLGLALQLDGRAGEAMRVLHPVAARGDNVDPAGTTEGVRLARRLLGEPAEDATIPPRPILTPYV
jgi:predicted Zn-dependent protease